MSSTRNRYCHKTLSWELSIIEELTMNKLNILSLRAFSALAVCAAVAMPVSTMAQSRDRTKAGTLTCDISGGIGLIIASKKDVTCMFTPAAAGPREVYVGSISKFGLDVRRAGW
jgi:hypothetical protein